MQARRIMANQRLANDRKCISLVPKQIDCTQSGELVLKAKSSAAKAMILQRARSMAV